MRLLNWLDRVDRRLGFSREDDSVDRSWVAYRGFLGPIALLLGLGTWLVSQEHWWAILLGAVIYAVTVALAVVFVRAVRTHRRRVGRR